MIDIDDIPTEIIDNHISAWWKLPAFLLTCAAIISAIVYVVRSADG